MYLSDGVNYISSHLISFKNWFELRGMYKVLKWEILITLKKGLGNKEQYTSNDNIPHPKTTVYVALHLSRNYHSDV